MAVTKLVVAIAIGRNIGGNTAIASGLRTATRTRKPNTARSRRREVKTTPTHQAALERRIPTPMAE